MERKKVSRRSSTAWSLTILALFDGDGWVEFSPFLDSVVAQADLGIATILVLFDVDGGSDASHRSTQRPLYRT